MGLNFISLSSKGVKMEFDKKKISSWFMILTIICIIGGFNIGYFIKHTSSNQETIVEAGLTGDYELAFKAFQNDANMPLDPETARKLYDEMLEKTKAYLPAYDKYVASRK